jgi:hypothetical protein
MPNAFNENFVLVVIIVIVIIIDNICREYILECVPDVASKSDHEQNCRCNKRVGRARIRFAGDDWQ